MAEFVQLLVSGLATGAIYALAAMGFTLLWQTSQTINFAQGEFVMLPAFIMLSAIKLFGLPLYAAFGVSLLVSALLLGFGFKRLLVDPMIRHGVLPLVIATIALGIFLKEGVKLVYGAEALPFPEALPQGIWRFASVSVTVNDIGVLLLVFAMVLALQGFLSRTTTGRAMQAVAQNPDTARILGIDVPRMITYTFLVNAALVSVAALLITPVYLAKFDNGESIGLIAFIAAIVGGFNQIRGALVGGLLIGVIDNLSGAYISAAYREAFPLLLLIAVILFRPQGLLGRAEERRV
ncbi:MAG: branched-chain amino acid ABC transporter permease [Alphaproteobacteria bacterium]|nr:branched-chain amino acid ABC transporter permease [Alphaproteobacteria bacterium]